ncbi:MAG: polysaccharide biosynthesis/export family protein [Candidatus Omnitrophota bacterium]|jgi:polysaccharide export outer membrane protein
MSKKLILVFTMLLLVYPTMNVFSADTSLSEEVKPLEAGPIAETKMPQEALGGQMPEEIIKEKPPAEIVDDTASYKIGVDDVLDIQIIQPEQMLSTVVVSPDGAVTVPYAGNVKVAGLSLPEAEELVKNKLADGYLKYPVISIGLRENRSKKFFVYGEVMKPGTYPLLENTTVLKAISTAGGFTKYGSSSRVKVLRPKKGSPDYETIKINLSAVMGGNSKADVVLEPGDTVVVSEGIF